LRDLRGLTAGLWRHRAKHIRRWGEPAMTTLRAKWRSVISYAKLVLHPFGLASLVGLIAVILIEFLWPTARSFFGRYPVTLGIIVGLLNLIFTLSVVNRFIQRRDELRWRDIRGITLKGLNDEVRATRDILWVALFGRPVFGVSRQTEAACKTAKRSGVKWPKTPLGDASAQILAMESDAHWTTTAAEILRMATEQIREGLVRWAPTMALAGGDYRVMGPVAGLADVLESMGFPFDNKRRNDGKSGIDVKFRWALHDLWLHAMTTCVYVEEDIVRTAYPAHEYPDRGPGPWTSVGPREYMLSEKQRTELDAWLKDADKFETANRERQREVTKHLDWPW
jgi:hypothetical protein